MNGVDHPELTDPIGEGVLRGALRLEADERPPRLDAAALVAAAGQRTLLDLAHAAVRGVALAGVGLGFLAVVVVIGSNAVAALDLTGPASLALSVLAEVARWVVSVAQVTADPSVAVAALATVLFATVYERGSGRERMHVRAS
jgi:hypothetical protein